MYNFNVEEQTQKCIEWIKNWFKNNGNDETKAIVGISGGKDSTVTAGLLVKALGEDRVIGVMMPNNIQSDISDSIEVCKYLNIKNYTINIGETYKCITDELRQVSVNGIEFPTKQYETNTPARIRMLTLYGIGALLGNCRIANTGNASENVVGFATIYGDHSGDFSLLDQLTTEEVVAIGDYIELPYYLVHKTPSDGMCGSSDEQALGFSYHEVNELLREGIKGEHYNEIMKKYNDNKFKTNLIHFPRYESNLPVCLN